MNKLDVKYHIGFWLVKIAIIFLFFHWPTRHESAIFWLNSPLIICCHIAYFYSIFSWAFPKLFAKGKVLLFILASIGLSAVHGLILMFLWSGYENVFSLSIGEYSPGLIGANFVFFGISFTWCHLNYLIDLGKERYLQKEDLSKAKLQLFANQINPKFILNILRFLQKKHKNSELEYESVRHNFEILLNQIKKIDNKAQIDLFDELLFLKSYLNIQAKRFDAKVEYQFPILEPKQLKITPLLIIALLENAFQHGELGSKGLISVKFSVRRRTFILSLRNSISSEYQKKAAVFNAEEQVTGESLQHLTQRLNVLYPDRFELTNDFFGDYYLTQLKIDLDVA